MENANSKSDLMNGSTIRLPKNIRQIGYFGGSKRIIYVEDYVMTFMKQLAQKEHTGLRVAVLLGNYMRTEDGKSLFIKGAVEMKEDDFTGGTSFSDEGWTSVYENIKRYFTDVEIVGWSLVGPGFFITSEEAIKKIHINNFHGPDKILLKIDSMEKEEAFYSLENNQLVKQTGYYIYYEKNEEMQNYMVENKEPVYEEANFNDQTTKKIRTVIQEKKEPKDDKSIVRLMYAASTLMAVIVLVIAATMLKNYEQMHNMQIAINALSENLDATSKNMQLETEAPALPVSNVESSDIEKETAKDQENKSVEVETVEGNVEPTKANNTQTVTGENGTNTDRGIATGTDKVNATTREPNEETEAVAKETEAAPVVAPVKEPVKETKYYTVKSGDYLAGISYKLYNSANYVSKIMELNGIDDPNKIYAGQKLIVP